jgi:hypothetical protein
MLLVVAAALAGTMSALRTPNWANGARIAMSSRLIAVARATLRWVPGRRLAMVDDRMAMSSPSATVERRPSGSPARHVWSGP